MVQLIDDYVSGRLDFYRMVGDLEATLDAAEIKDQVLVKQWYTYWIPLETERALNGNAVERTDVTSALNQMRTFLVLNLS
jgi:hypothetical protein